MTTESMPAATPSALVGDIACAAVLKCPSPVTLAAAHIARQMGVLTDFSVPGAAGDEPPSLRVGNANGSILVFELEKENVCPVTGVYARLASGEGASGPGDTGIQMAHPLPALKKKKEKSCCRHFDALQSVVGFRAVRENTSAIVGTSNARGRASHLWCSE